MWSVRSHLKGNNSKIKCKCKTKPFHQPSGMAERKEKDPRLRWRGREPVRRSGGSEHSGSEGKWLRQQTKSVQGL